MPADMNVKFQTHLRGTDESDESELDITKLNPFKAAEKFATGKALPVRRFFVNFYSDR